MRIAKEADKSTAIGIARTAIASLIVLALVSAAAASAVAPATSAVPTTPGFRAGEAFTFLFLAMGPPHVIPGFAALTAGRDRKFKASLALHGMGAAALAIALAGTLGVSFLDKWHLSLPALALAAALLLLLVALNQLLGTAHHAPAAAPSDGEPRLAELAFSPLAVPIIIPPFGMGVVILLLAIAQQRGAIGVMAGLIAIMLALDFLAMIFADKVVRIAWLRYLLSLLGTIIGVMQVALAVQTIANSIRELNIV